jgi:hypothetical protein
MLENEISTILVTALRNERTGGDFYRPIWLTIVFCTVTTIKCEDLIEALVKLL